MNGIAHDLPQDVYVWDRLCQRCDAVQQLLWGLFVEVSSLGQ
jgi:hypothetical protein